MLSGTPAPAWRRSMSVTVPLCAEDLDVRGRPDRVGVRACCTLGDEFHVEDH
jgi:hypothetical protein